MNKDIFEIKIGEQLRDANASVPKGAWEAIQSQVQGGSSAVSAFKPKLGLLIGGAMMLSLAYYSANRSTVESHEGASVHHAQMAHDADLQPQKAQKANSLKAVESEGQKLPESHAQIAVVEKSPSSIVVNDAVEVREVEAFELDEMPINSVNQVQTQDRVESPKIQTVVKAPEEMIQEEVAAAVETAQIDAIIGASEIFGYAPLKVKFDNLGDGDSYAWDFGKWGGSREKSPEVTFEEPGTYVVYLTVTSDDGQESVDQIQVKVQEGSSLTVHNAFSPNGDGINDTYKIEGAYNIESFLMIITNQRGEIVFQTRDINEGWSYDATVHGGDGDSYFVTYKAVGVDGRVHAAERMALNIVGY